MTSSSSVFQPPPRLAYAVLFYALSMALVFASKPPFAFRDDGTIRPFGIVERDGTMCSVGVLAVVLAIGSFYIFCMIDAMEK